MCGGLGEFLTSHIMEYPEIWKTMLLPYIFHVVVGLAAISHYLIVHIYTSIDGWLKEASISDGEC